MTTLKHVFSVGILLFSSILTAKAQHPVTPTHFGSSPVYTNQAMSLLTPSGEFGVLGRRQWVGMEGAPTVFWASGHLGMERIGATTGLQLRHERVGVEKLTEASAFFAKSVRLSEKDYLGLSMNAGIGFFRGAYSGVDPMDPAFRDDVQSTDALLGFGVVYYRPERYYLGVSVPRLVLGQRDDPNRYDLKSVYHLNIGALFGMGEDFHLRPTALVSYAANLTTTLDLSAMMYMKRRVGLGLGYRTAGDLSGMLEVLAGGFSLGYGYQFHPGSQALNSHITNSTHEVGISYRFGGQRGLL